MKTRSIVLALALSIGLFATSCNNDDNEGETLAPLAGKWNLSKTGTIVGNTETLVDAPENASGCDKDYLNLKIDNTVTTGDFESVLGSCAETTRNGIYSRSHNDLTIVIDNVTTTQDIVNLTLSELKLKDDSGNVTVYTR